MQQKTCVKELEDDEYNDKYEVRDEDEETQTDKEGTIDV